MSFSNSERKSVKSLFCPNMCHKSFPFETCHVTASVGFGKPVLRSNKDEPHSSVSQVWNLQSGMTRRPRPPSMYSYYRECPVCAGHWLQHRSAVTHGPECVLSVMSVSHVIKYHPVVYYQSWAMRSIMCHQEKLLYLYLKKSENSSPNIVVMIRQVKDINRLGYNKKHIFSKIFLFPRVPTG